MLKKVTNFISAIVTVVVAGFILGVFCAAFLLPVFTTWKFIFSAII